MWEKLKREVGERIGHEDRGRGEREREGFLKLKERECSTEALKLNCNQLQIPT